MNIIKIILRDFIGELKIAMREVPRIYFAPFVGAYRGIKAELKALEARGKVH